MAGRSARSAETVLDAYADFSTRVDRGAAKLVDQIAARRRELLDDPTERDPQLWADVLADAGLDVGELLEATVDEFLELPVADRDLVGWTYALSAMWVASLEQAVHEAGLWAHVFGLSDTKGAAINDMSRPMDEQAMRKAAITGVGKGRFDLAKKAVEDEETQASNGRVQAQ